MDAGRPGPAAAGQHARNDGAPRRPALAQDQHRHRHLHAFPAADHPASNAICRKAGFALLGETDVEYPPGNIMRCNDWRLELEPQNPD